jgi:hypothetical protein
VLCTHQSCFCDTFLSVKRSYLLFGNVESTLICFNAGKINGPQIKSDVETKGDFIRFLIEKVQSAAYTKMEDVLKFVEWIDRELSTLVIPSFHVHLFVYIYIFWKTIFLPLYNLSASPRVTYIIQHCSLMRELY